MIQSGSDNLTYEELLVHADDEGLIVKEKPLTGSDGRIYRNRIAIRSDLKTSVEKACTLAEEIGHYKTTSGNIVKLNDIADQKQEYRARLYGYNLAVGLLGIIKCYENGCKSIYEMAEHLNVSENYLTDALECYKRKYGLYTTIDNYIIYFEPCLGVMKMN